MDRNARARAGGVVDVWAEITGAPEQQQQSTVQPIYQRRRQPSLPTPTDSDHQLRPQHSNHSRVSFAAAADAKRVSWNRSLSTRGRTSIAVAPCVANEPQQKQPRRRGKPPVPKGKIAEHPNFEKEREYFRDVDSFELLEESPSSKHFGTWATGNQTVPDPIPPISSRLEKWLLSKKINFSCGPSSTLSKILETPASMDHIYTDDLDSSIVKTLEKCGPKSLVQVCEDISASYGDQGCEDINASIRKLSLASTTTSHFDRIDPFTALLGICEQSTPLQFLDIFSKYCAPENIAKVGEGTYGEAFRAGNTVCKIVPFDGDFPVNGEVQKKSEELLEEAVLSKALNSLREFEKNDFNACTTFIETIDLKVCQGLYDAALVRTWEKWDEKNGSENDHPKEFPEKQRYLVFVLQHGGKDLESFVLENFDEARSLLVQVTAAMAVAEAAYEFEHRDLHWGNILLSRKDSVTMKFMLEGKQISFRTYGLSVSIIDFTLSRLNTGENILFLDLSQDPYLFKGPKGDKQSETYRKMKEVTEDHWEGSFPRTNVLWLIYLVDILLLKKTYLRSSKNERDMRSLKKRLDKYDSAKEAIFDPFFEDLLVNN
ncbi:putative hydrolase [Hibiscus syriacus]|uniref:non-specific serine/threonine protein kinase n=1 Tax=Hibiscus syriacus TaxID=106335 RepID=A0A6A3AP75_HIBSY|nr:serine/threonine-protein kinase haspin homolog [Hibiscus syriacus]KAE8706424.1 putative hydrolase [Hibiscus syriacus]